MLPPSAEEGFLPNEKAGFPDTTNITRNRSKHYLFLQMTSVVCNSEAVCNYEFICNY